MIRIDFLDDFIAAPYQNETDDGLIESYGHGLSRVADRPEGAEYVRINDVNRWIQETVVLTMA